MKKSNIILIIVGIVVFIGLCIASIFLFINKSNEVNDEEEKQEKKVDIKRKWYVYSELDEDYYYIDFISNRYCEVYLPEANTDFCEYEIDKDTIVLTIGENKYIEDYKITKDFIIIGDNKFYSDRKDSKKTSYTYHFYDKATNEVEEEEEVEQVYDTSMFGKINPSKIKDLSNGRTIVIWMGRQECHYCANFAPVMEYIVGEYGTVVFYYDVSSIFDEENDVEAKKNNDIMRSLTGDGQYKDFMSENFGATPVTIFVRDNKIVGTILGAVDKSTVESEFDRLGFER